MDVRCDAMPDTLDEGKADCFTNRPFAVKYGRRPVYLLSNLLMGLACVWLGIASNKTYVSLLVGRAFLGIFEAPIESIVPSTITDIFHLHDRGEKVSVYGLSVLGGNELGPMFSAFIIQSLGMGWAFYIIAIIIGGNLATMFFFMPETKFDGPRPSILPVESDEKVDKELSDHVENLSNGHVQAKDNTPEVPKRSYIQSLAIWSPPDQSVNLLHVFLRPFILLTYPTVVWSCIIYGLALGWNVILGATVAQLYAPPYVNLSISDNLTLLICLDSPYHFNSSAQGLVFLSPFIGSLVGTYLCGPLADRIANYYTRRNHGIREPEMRLPTCIIAALLTFLGALWSGLSYQRKTHWIVPIIGFGVLSAGAQMGATLAMAYALDSHKEVRSN
jgi:MFS family permease